MVYKQFPDREEHHTVSSFPLKRIYNPFKEGWVVGGAVPYALFVRAPPPLPADAPVAAGAAHRRGPGEDSCACPHLRTLHQILPLKGL